MMKLRKVLFWDTDVEKIDLEKNSSYIIERVANYGLYEEWRELLLYYGSERVKSTVLGLRSLDKKTLNYLAHYFHVSKENFRCYTLQQSFPTHYPS